jgi:hypothetical protein
MSLCGVHLQEQHFPGEQVGNHLIGITIKVDVIVSKEMLVIMGGPF